VVRIGGALLIFSPWLSASGLGSTGAVEWVAAAASYGIRYGYIDRFLARRGISPVTLSACSSWQPQSCSRSRWGLTCARSPRLDLLILAGVALTRRNIRRVTPGRPREPDPRWQALFPEQGSLAEHINQWTVGEAVPPGVADVLRVARTLLIDSYYEYEYSLVAVAWGFLVVEACLHGCVSPGDESGEDKRSFGMLVKQAETDGLITKQEATVLFQVVKFRNDIFHRAYLQVKPPPDSYPPDTALQMLESIHDAVSDIYARAVSQLTSRPSMS